NITLHVEKVDATGKIIKQVKRQLGRHQVTYVPGEIERAEGGYTHKRAGGFHIDLDGKKTHKFFSKVEPNITFIVKNSNSSSYEHVDSITGKQEWCHAGWQPTLKYKIIDKHTGITVMNYEKKVYIPAIRACHLPWECPTAWCPHDYTDK
ncbi:MAG: hypothetical protein ACRCR9_05510, partial [Chitinophagaceae bacterium]